MRCVWQLSAWVAAQQERLAEERLRRPEGCCVLLTDVPGGVDAGAARNAAHSQAHRTHATAAVFERAFHSPFPFCAARAVFASLYPDTFLAAVPVLDSARCDALAAERDALRCALERATAAAAAAAAEHAPRPTHRTGLLGLLGDEVDSVAAHTARLEAVESRLAAARAAALSCTPSDDAPPQAAAFLAFASPRAAAQAAQAALCRDTLAWRLAPAPPPDDLLWRNVGRYAALSGILASSAALAATYALVCFYMVPVAAVSALSSLTNLSRALPFLKPLVKAPAVQALLEGLLPGLALIICLAALPALMRALALSAGERTRSGLACAEVRSLFLFSAVNVFLGHVVAGSVLSDIRGLLDNAWQPGAVLNVLGTTVPRTSRFFINLVALKSIAGAASQATCIRFGALFALRARRAPPGAAAAAAWAPAPAILSGDIADILLVALLTIVFSTIAPIMHLVGITYFFLRLGAIRSCVLYRHEAGYDGGGALWAPARGRLFAACLIYQFTLSAIFALKRAPAPAALTLGLVMPATAVAARAMAHRFDAAAPGGGRAHPMLAWAHAAAGGGAVAQAPAEGDGEAVPLVPLRAGGSAGGGRVHPSDDGCESGGMRGDGDGEGVGVSVSVSGEALLSAYLPPCLRPPPPPPPLDAEQPVHATGGSGSEGEEEEDAWERRVARAAAAAARSAEGAGAAAAAALGRTPAYEQL
jgi:hypothetical protein